MSIETWGDMNKSQIDSTLIETRISEMIAEHEADPTAHMGDGESISQHRENDIIDHPAGSTVGDKLTMTEFSFVPNLRDNTLFSTYENNGAYDDGNPPSVFVSAWGETEYCGRSALLLGLTSFLDWDKNMLCQFNMVINEHEHYNAYLGFFYYSSGTFTEGFGFKIIDDLLYGFYISSTGMVSTSVIAFTPGNLTNLRAQYNATTRDLEFYVNGELAETLTVGTVPALNHDGRITFTVEGNDTGAEVALAVFDIYFVRGI